MRVAVFASGRGSNLASILARIDDGSLRNVDVRIVISNRSDAGALDLARSRGIRALHLSSATHGDPAALETAMLAVLEAEGAELLVLAGYLKRLPPGVVRRFAGRVINIHPALLPRHGGRGMYGAHVHEAVLRSGDRETGVTVHLVDEEYDHGPILRQVRVPVIPGDTPESLSARVLAAEHDLYWRVVAELAEKTAR